MAYSKIIYGGNVLIDLTGDTVAADKLLAGITAHGKDGEEITGTCAYDAATGDATAAEGEILLGKTAYVKGAKKTGTMPNRGAVTGTIATKAGEYTVPAGYHNRARQGRQRHYRRADVCDRLHRLRRTGRKPRRRRGHLSGSGVIQNERADLSHHHTDRAGGRRGLYADPDG